VAVQLIRSTQPYRKLTGGPAQGTTIVSVVIDENTVHNVYLQNGKQVSLTRVTNSKDGKSVTMTFKSTDAQRKPVEEIIVMEKQ
jgi:hypothetical protein